MGGGGSCFVVVHICPSLLKITFQTRRGTIFIPPSLSGSIKYLILLLLIAALSSAAPLLSPLVHLHWTEEEGQVQEYFLFPPSATPWSITHCMCVCVCVWQGGSHGCGVPCTVCVRLLRKKEMQSDWADGRAFPVGLVSLCTAPHCSESVKKHSALSRGAAS